MTEYHDTRLEQERQIRERIAHYGPFAAVGAFCLLVLAGLLYAQETSPANAGLIMYGVFFALVVLVAAFVKPEIALIAVTIAAPLEAYTQQIPNPFPGTGLTPLNILTLILIAGAWAQKYSTSEPAVKASSVDTPLLLMVAIGTLAVITGILRWDLDNQDIGAFQQFALAMLLYWVARRRFRSAFLARVAVYVVCLMVLFESFMVMKGYSAADPQAFSWKLKSMITGTIVNGNSNDTGAYLTQYGAIALGLFLGLRRSVLRWPALFIWFASVVATFYTYSRAAYIALAVTALLMLLWKQRRWLVPMIAAAVFLLPMLPSSVSERLSTTGDSSAENRKEFWKEGMKMALLHPFTGVGWRGYSKSEGHDPHNMYVLVGAEQGLVGFVVFVVLLGAAGKEIVRANWRARQPFTQALALGMFGSYVALLVNNMFGSRLVWFYGGAHFWLLLGVLLVLVGKDEAEAAPAAPEVSSAPVEEGPALPPAVPAGA